MNLIALNKLMRRLFVLQAFGIVVLFGHDNRTIHPMLTDKAYEAWANKGSVFDSIGVVPIAKFSFTIPTDSPSLLVGGGPPPWTLKEWLMAGSIDEDAPDARCLAHFYNPLSATHELTDPYTVSGRNSYDWASAGTAFDPHTPGTPSPGQNEECWSTARTYYWDAVTSSLRADRDRNLVHVFYALGKIIHLLQDLSQPEHVRNDAHMINGAETPVPVYNRIAPTARWIENYGRDNISLISSWPELSGASALDWRSAGFTKVLDFWNRSLYNGTNPNALDADASGSPSSLLGLSEFINGNFLGADASYAELVTAGGHHFAHPALTDTDYAMYGVSGSPMLASTWEDSATINPVSGKIRKSVFLRKLRSGITVEKHSVLNYSLLYRLRLTGLSQDHPVYPSVTINAPDVLREYHKLTLPKAIEYSAGLIDYFFRGQFDGYCEYNEQTQMYNLSVFNYSGLPLSGGDFTIYWDDANGNRTAYSNVISTYDPAMGLAEYDWVDFEIPVPAAAAAFDATKAIVVYQGTIGAVGTDPNADSVDQGKAIAALQFGLPPIPVPMPQCIVTTSSASKTKTGIGTYCQGLSSIGGYGCNDFRVFKQIDFSGGMSVGNVTGDTSCFVTYSVSGHIRIAPDGSVEEDTTSGNYNASCYNGQSCTGKVTPEGWYRAPTAWSVRGPCTVLIGPGGQWSSSSGLVNTYTAVNGSTGSTSATLSDEYTTTKLKAYTTDSLTPLGELSSYYGSIASASLSDNELTYSAKKGKYAFYFILPRVVAGKSYTITWDERFVKALTYDGQGHITGGGEAITSIEVLNGGTGYIQAAAVGETDGSGGIAGIYPITAGVGYVSAPQVTISPPDTLGGTQATAIASVSAGSVNTITIINAGSGYTRGPTVTLAPPSGAPAPTITLGVPGNGGTTATASVLLNSQGEIGSVSLGAGGSRYLYEPYIQLDCPYGLGAGAVLRVHLGAETHRTYTYSGVPPAGYNPSDPATWPRTGEYNVAVPEFNGTVTIANVSGQFITP
jgi:hypothetical protein